MNNSMKNQGRNVVAKKLFGVWMLLAACMGMGTVQAQTVEYIHTDALGTPAAVTDANRNVIERSEYEPYGALLNRPISDGPGYTGHVMDAATGLTYMQQRYYDPQIGRFLSIDPVTAYGGDLRHFNRYAYAYSNPYSFTDPDGRCPDGATKRTCIESTNEARAGSTELSAQSEAADKSQGGRAIVRDGSTNETLAAGVNDPATGSEKVVVFKSDTKISNDVATGEGVPPANMVFVTHGHISPTLEDSDKAGSMGDAGVLKKNGVPNIARDTTGRRAVHEVVNDRYQVRALGNTRFTADEIEHFEARMNERQDYLNGD